MNAFTKLNNQLLAVQSNGMDKLVSLFMESGKLGQQAIAFINGKHTAPNARAFLGLSKNSKMPAYTLAIPARQTCPRGDKLAQVVGTVCHGCFAMKGHDAMRPAKDAKARRLAVIKLALGYSTIRTLWLMAFKVAMTKETYFRWHSAGDIFSAEYADLMAHACTITPQVKHWVPTREAQAAKPLLALSNVVVRVSDDMVNQVSNKHVGNTSGVHTGPVPSRGFTCPAPQNAGSCGECRTCWNSAISHVSYHLH